ncbi:MAG: hypothetical protein ACRD4L_13765, partial [Pyrinomonadaceae bacterium]
MRWQKLILNSVSRIIPLTTILTGIIWAQAGSGAFSGQVKDQQGGLLQGAKVTLFDHDKERNKRVVNTDNEG